MDFSLIEVEYFNFSIIKLQENTNITFINSTINLFTCLHSMTLPGNHVITISSRYAKKKTWPIHNITHPYGVVEFILKKNIYS